MRNKKISFADSMSIRLLSLVRNLFFVGVFAVAFSSCISHKQLLILDEGQPYTTDSLAVIENYPGPIIQTDDKLLVKVSSFDQQAAAPFNQQSMLGLGGQQGGMNNQRGGQGVLGGDSQSGIFGQAGNNNQNNISQNGNQNGMGQQFLGYLVDPNSNIEFPVIGTVRLGGMTLDQAKLKLYELLDEYLINYAVDVQFINRRITVSGEVENPGLVQLDRDRISIIEAIQRAGGITVYSNTENIQVIREKDGERLFATLNLHDRDIVNSQFYYIYPNDVVYLQPIRAKTFTAQTSFFSAFNIITSLISAAALIVAFSR
ncbi:MAG: polysaccharide biosynthesis/export family protein [Cyclobacteriaceae bacterium]